MARGLYLYPAASGESFREVILYVLENKSSGQSAREGFFKEGRAQCALLCDSKNVKKWLEWCSPHHDKLEKRKLTGSSLGGHVVSEPVF